MKPDCYYRTGYLFTRKQKAKNLRVNIYNFDYLYTFLSNQNVDFSSADDKGKIKKSRYNEIKNRNEETKIL